MDKTSGVYIFLLGACVLVLIVGCFFRDLSAQKFAVPPWKGPESRLVFAQFDPVSRVADMEIRIDPQIPQREMYAILLPSALSEPSFLTWKHPGDREFVWSVHALRGTPLEVSRLPSGFKGGNERRGGKNKVSLIGEPALYPFDEYKFVGYVHTPAAYATFHRHFFIKDASFRIVFENRLASFLARPLSQEEIASVILVGLSDSQRDPISGKTDLDAGRSLVGSVEWNDESGIGIALVRPCLLRWSASLSFILGISWALRIVFLEHLRTIREATALGSLSLIVWGIFFRNEPVFPSSPDYALGLMSLVLLVLLGTKWIKARRSDPPES